MEMMQTYAAFFETRLIARGELVSVLQAVCALDAESSRAVLFFDETTGAQVDFDLRGSWEEIRARMVDRKAAPMNDSGVARGPGRPKLGVVCREVCLLPAQWEWLSRQPGGASVALRKLVHESSRKDATKGGASACRGVVDRVLLALAGNQPGYEEASRALWAGDMERMAAIVRDWPGDIGPWAISLLQGED